MAGERPSAEDFSKELRKELEETPGEIEGAPKPEVLEMEEMSKEEIEDIHEQREQVEKITEASAELHVAMISEAESPEEIKKIMGKVDRMSALLRAETLEVLPEKPLAAVEALGDEHKGVNSSYILRLVEKRISGQEGTEEIVVEKAIYKPKKGASGGVEYLKALWEDPNGRAMLESLGVKPGEDRKLEDFFPGIEKKNLRPGIEKDSLHLREWLASMIDAAIGTDVVPPTVLRMEKDGVGSLQEFAPDAKSHYEDPSRQIDKEEMAKMAIFDFVAGSQDKGDTNYLAGKKLPGRETRKAHSIDNGYILSTGLESQMDELDIISEPLEQFNPDRAEGGRVLDPSLPASLEKSLGKFLESKKMQGALRKCFDIALGPQAEKAWQGFVARVEKIHSGKNLPTKHNAETGRGVIGQVFLRETMKLASVAQTEKAA